MAEEKQVEKSSEKDLKKLRKQAKDGVLKAQFLLAVKLANGDGGEADPKEAEKWYRKAAKRDFPPAMNNLALLYTSDALGDPDLKAALKWYRKAAELGYARAQAILGWRLVRGNGVTATKPKAWRC
jgi:TPR repeat protein